MNGIQAHCEVNGRQLKPIVLVNSENYKFLSEWVVSVLKALCIILSETINILRKLHKTNIFWMPPRFYHRVMYKAPSTGHGLLNLNLPFKLMLRRFEVVFWCLEWECCTFGKIDKNTLRSTCGFNPKKAGSFDPISQPRGGGWIPPPPSDLGRGAPKNYVIWHIHKPSRDE